MPSVFAGYSLSERLAVDTFGELWAATGPDGRRAGVRVVEAGLSGHPTFASAFLRAGEGLAAIEHPNVVSTIAVGLGEGGELVAVHEPIDAPVTLDAVLRDGKLSGVRPTPQVALYVARQVAKALSRAHRAGVVHGGVHPRSIVIDAHGQVRLGDFAVARALAAAATEDDSLLRGLLGYVAPELVLGDAPDPRSDVFACGALLHELYTGSPPPGLVEGPPALASACERALHTDRDDRYPDATELLLALDAAAVQLGEAGLGEVARFVAESRGGAERHIDAATEDVLASLIDDLGDADAEREPTPLPPPMPMAGEDRPSDRFPALLDLDGTGPSGAVSRFPLPAGPDSGIGPLAPAARLDSDIVAQRVQTADVISEALDLSRAGRDPTTSDSLETIVRDELPSARLGSEPRARPRRASSEPVAAPAVAAPAPARRPVSEPVAPAAAPVPSRPAPATREGRSSRAVGTGAAPALPPIVGAPTGPAALPSLAELSMRRSGGSWTLWVAAVAVVVAVGVVVWKAGVLDPGARTAAARAAEDKAIAEQRAIAMAAKRFADIVVDSDQPGAAVWMLVGRTPVDTITLSTASIYELRVEQDGFEVHDTVVTPSRWSGAGDAMSAAVRVTLEPAPDGYVAPAAPTEAPPAETTAKAGRGRIHIDSEPAASQVWLLVGFTPAVRVTNLPTDRDHDFKIMLDGHVPAFAHVAKADFLDPSGATKPQVLEKVSLRPRPKGAPGAASSRSPRSPKAPSPP